MQFFGKEQQDEFAYYLIGESGFFLDLGCHEPFIYNNTAALEAIGWSGLLFDYVPDLIQLCKINRKSPAFCVDVSTSEFISILNSYSSTKVFDFISADSDGGNIPALVSLIENGYSFKCMTFEHDAYKEGDNRRKPSRELLNKFGYVMLFDDVITNAGLGVGPWEDWWINPKYFSEDLLNYKLSESHHSECISKLKEEISAAGQYLIR